MTTDAYELSDLATERARRDGLADADWYLTPVAAAQMREFTRRTNGRAAVDAAIWITLVVAGGVAVALTFGSWWCLLAMLAYGATYGGASDARWHEYGHGTAFANPHANVALYYIASFMLLREPTMSKWTHFRHHSDTIIVGRDPEIILRRPPRLGMWVLNLFDLVAAPQRIGRMIAHAGNRFSGEERNYLPADQRRRATWEARAFLLIPAAVIAVSLIAASILPALLIGLPTFYGAWLVSVFNVTQHGALQENVTDHRLSTRTYYLNPIGRFLYLNMNYHIEHHMYPAVPYHRLPALHDAIKHDSPAANRSLTAVYREMLPALIQQRHDPTYQVPREIPHLEHHSAPSERHHSTPLTPTVTPTGGTQQLAAGDWVRIADVDEVAVGGVHRADIGDHTFAIYRTSEEEWLATDGICTHSRTVHLATGTLLGCIIECPKHNGQFDIVTGDAVRKPATKPLATHRVEARDDGVYLQMPAPSATSETTTPTGPVRRARPKRDG